MRCFQPLGIAQLRWTKNRLENAVSMYGGLRALRREHHFDLVEMPECGAEGLLVNHLTREKTFVRLHSPARFIMPFYEVKQADIALCSFAEQIGIWGACAFTACSRFLADEARKKLGISKPIRVIPNGIDLELFDKAEQIDVHSKYDLPRNRLMIFFSGRMERRKGIHLCGEIAASIMERYEVAFVFAGQDLFHYMSETLLPYLKTRTLRGSVHYLGKLDLADIRSCLLAADIFFLPSLWENCPYSCLEAMAAGCAIVSSDQAGMPDLIHDGENGLLARSGDPNSYISCIDRLIEDDNLREQLGRSARKTIEESFTDVNTARLSVEYYLECLKKAV